MEKQRADLCCAFASARYVLSTFHRSSLNIQPPWVEDALAMFIIVYSAKRLDGGLARVVGMPSLLDKILQDATTYFLILSTGHILCFFFEIFAPVSDNRVDFSFCRSPQLPHVGFD